MACTEQSHSLRGGNEEVHTCAFSKTSSSCCRVRISANAVLMSLLMRFLSSRMSCGQCRNVGDAKLHVLCRSP